MHRVMGEKKPAKCPNCDGWMLVADTQTGGDGGQAEQARWYGICDECQEEVSGPSPETLEIKD